MITKETVLLIVLSILHHTQESSTHQGSGHKGHEQNEVATVSTNVTGTGFHRFTNCWLTTVLEGLFGEYHSSSAALGRQRPDVTKQPPSRDRHFTCQLGLPSGIVMSGCHIAVHLQVPREMYFDFDQISMLNGGNHSSVYSAHPVSTELPVDAVEESMVWLFAGVESERFEIRLPIHMRYQPPSEQGYANVHSLPEPHQLLVNCESSSSLHSATGTVLLAAINACMAELVPCPWREVSFTSSDGHRQWEGRVPCGVTYAAPYITLTTVLVTLLCMGYLLHALIAVSNEQTSSDRLGPRHHRN